MLLKVLRGSAEVKEAQNKFEEAFRIAGVRKTVKAGHKGETLVLDGYWISAENLWVGFRRLRNRYWNAFGVGLSASNSIACEINFALDGDNPRVAGVLAKDENSKV